MKRPKFSFSFPSGTNVTTAKTVIDLKLSGSDTSVILASACEFEGKGVRELFEGVLYQDVLVPDCDCEKKRASFEILQKIHDNTLPTITALGVTGPSERSICDLLFLSLKKIHRFCRDPQKTSTDFKELKLYVETYFHCGLLLFKNSQTPYKVRYHVMVELLRFGKIRSLFDHLSEATENSNHESQLIFATHTMREGGFIEKHQSPEFTDLFNSFNKALQLAFDNFKSRGLSPHLSFLKNRKNEESVMEVYLKTIRKPLPRPRMMIEKTTAGKQLWGLRFLFLGDFRQMQKYRKKKYTADQLKDMTKELGGTVVANTLAGAVATSDADSNGNQDEDEDEVPTPNKSQDCYCVLPNRNLLDWFKNLSRTTIKKIPKVFHFLKNWSFIKVEYILDCYHEKKLLNPTEYRFDLGADFKRYFSASKDVRTTSFLQRQRRPRPWTGKSNGEILAKNALQRYLHPKPDSKTRERRRLDIRKDDFSKMTTKRLALKLFMRDYIAIQKPLFEREGGKLEFKSLNKSLFRQWNEPGSKKEYFKQARKLKDEQSPQQSPESHGVYGSNFVINISDQRTFGQDDTCNLVESDDNAALPHQDYHNAIQLDGSSS